MTRHKVFISYHHADQGEVQDFVDTFDYDRRVFLNRTLGLEMQSDIINSNNTTYVMKKIRELYLRDSTVTVVLLGKCTWARRYVDWEIQASLRCGEYTTPNGLLAIKLPSFPKRGGIYPERLNINLNDNGYQSECYARVYEYPSRKDQLSRWIDDAFFARKSQPRILCIQNPQDRFRNNRSCY